VPTPADIARRRQVADELSGALDDGAPRDCLRPTTVDVPVLDVPMRRDRPRPADTFTARIVDEDRGGAVHLVHEVTHWRIHDGALALYGERDGRAVKLQTINALHWTRVERLAGGAE
jgi:hypothetical protein